MFRRVTPLRETKLHTVRFQTNGGGGCGKCSFAGSLDLDDEILAVAEIRKTPAAAVMVEYLVAATIPFALLDDCFPEHIFPTLDRSAYKLATIIITRRFKHTLFDWLLHYDGTMLDRVVLKKLKQVVENAAILRACGWAHQDLKLDNVSSDCKFIDYEQAVGINHPNPEYTNHPVGWHGRFEDTAEFADVYSAVHSLWNFGGRKFRALPLLGEFRARMFALPAHHSHPADCTAAVYPGRGVTYANCTHALAISCISHLLGE